MADKSAKREVSEILVHLLRHAYFMPKGFEDIQNFKSGHCFIGFFEWCSSSPKVSHDWLATLWEYNRTNNRNNAPSPKTITAATMIKQKQLTTAATILDFSGLPIERNPFFKALFCGKDFNYSINTFHSLVLLSSKRNLHLKQHKTRQKEAQ